ncbi:hypothetical protein HPP92_019142 [Vanilla planifolia]|uniref:Uncharacterized protein n=1 Tax=Vanilla planifolia TaxID=51239 RepID=A0A835QH04_VANPL|nr:hypothetical protein HPP92_019142 [Vanilla planifolia]
MAMPCLGVCFAVMGPSGSGKIHTPRLFGRTGRLEQRYAFWKSGLNGRKRRLDYGVVFCQAYLYITYKDPTFVQSLTFKSYDPSYQEAFALLNS